MLATAAPGAWKWSLSSHPPISAFPTPGRARTQAYYAPAPERFGTVTAAPKGPRGILPSLPSAVGLEAVPSPGFRGNAEDIAAKVPVGDEAETIGGPETI